MNRTLLVSNHAADLRPILSGFKLSATERQDLVTLRAQLVELDAHLAQVSGPVVRAGLKSARCAIRTGAGSSNDLQAALRRADDKIDIRRALKARNAELGREAGRLLEPIFERAVVTVKPRAEKLRAEAVERITRLLPVADADQLAGQDVVLVAVEAAVELLETHARSCTDAQAEGGRWRPSADTLDRLLASLGEKISGE
jgi:hypothetical protein